MRTDRRELLALGIINRASLGDRIETLLKHGREFSPRASLTSVAAGTAILLTFTIAGSLAPRWIAFAQQSDRPSFEVASIRLNPACPVGGHEDEQLSHGRLSLTCIALRNLIQAAYVTFANGPNTNPRRVQLPGLPGWADSSRFDITAKASGDPRLDQMAGPMLQVLLEDRFHLKLHRETRQLPVYTLTVAPSGLKLQTAKEGSCTPVDLSHAGTPSPNFCGMTGRANGLYVIDDARGMSLPEIAGRMLSNRLDRPVIDKTGATGLFDAHLEFVRDTVPADPGSPAPPADAPGPSIFTAVQEQLGLNLSPDKGPVEVLIVDHVEKPSPN